MTIRRFPWRNSRTADPSFRAFATNQNHQQLRLLKQLPREARPVMAGIMEINPTRRSTLSSIMSDAWVKQIDVCTAAEPGARHVHHVLSPPILTDPQQQQRGNLVAVTAEPPGAVAEKEKRRRQQLFVQQQPPAQQQQQQGASRPSSPQPAHKPSPP